MYVLRRTFIHCLTCILMLLVAGRPEAADEPSPLAITIDTSGSMTGEKIAAAVEAAKLFIFLCDVPVVVGHFDDDGAASNVFTLPKQRAEALAEVDRLVSQTQGGTVYVAGLRVVPANARSLIFISDGEPSDDNEALQFVRDHIRCPIHAIAFDLGSRGQEILGKMAAASRGAAYNVKTPADLAGAFINIHEQIRQSRRHEGQGRIVVDDVSGEVLAIGFDAEPVLDPPLKVERHVTTIPSGKLFAARIHSSAKQDITITARSANQQDRRLIVIRFDLSRSVSRIEPTVVQGGQNFIPVRTRFQGDAGRIDPRGKASLSASYQLINPSGAVVSETPAKVAADKPEVAALISWPAPAGETGWQLRATTTDLSPAGMPFTETQIRALEPPEAQPKQAPTPPPPPVPPADDLLRLRVLARRNSQFTLLYDSAAPSAVCDAITGDPLMLELSAGRAISIDELITLGRSLRAEFITADGTTRNVPLTFEKDRYVTQPVEVKLPGKLRVRVHVEVQQTEINLEGNVTIHEPVWQLAVDDPLAGLAILPQHARIPFRVRLEATVGGRPATPDEILATLGRQGIRLQRSLVDSAGQELDREQLDLAALGDVAAAIESPAWFRQAGEQRLSYRLVDSDGRQLAQNTRDVGIANAPVDVTPGDGVTSSRSGTSWVMWFLPDWLCTVRSPRLTVLPCDSPLATTYYTAGVNVDGQPLVRSGEGYESGLPQGKSSVWVRLARYQVGRGQGPAEIQLLYQIDAVADRSISLFRIAILATSLGALVVLIRACIVYSWDRCQIRLIGDVDEEFLLQPGWSWLLWPSARALVVRGAEGQLQLVSPGGAPSGAAVVACIERSGRRTLKLHAREDLPSVNRGDVIILGELDDPIWVDSSTSLMVEFVAEAILVSD